MECLVCDNKNNTLYRNIDGVLFYECNQCYCIYADPCTIVHKTQDYVIDYWKKEMFSSRERSFGSTIALCAEVFILSSIKIDSFLDIGTGPGYFLDAASLLMPKYNDLFYGVEKYPPPEKFVSKHQNYIKGDLTNFKNMNKKFSGGICVEVIEHLSPSILRNLVENLSKISQEGALFIFNSGQPDYVKKEDLGYLDPYDRGHIISYSIKSLEIIFSNFGFKVTPIPGRSWAFIAEYKPKRKLENNADFFSQLVWCGLDENINKLKENNFGPLMYVIGMNSLRASIENQVVKERTLWALSLNEELKKVAVV